MQRYQEQRQRTEILRRRAETLTKLTETSFVLNFDQPLDQLLRTIGNHIRESTPFQAVLISIYERDTGLLRRITGVGFSTETLTELMSRKQPLSSIQQMLKPQFRISRSYFIPVDEAPIIPTDVHMVTLELEDKTGKSSNAWDPDDFLIIPLEDDQGTPLGLMSFDAPKDGLRPDRATIEALEIFAAQAALAISNHLRFVELRTKVELADLGAGATTTLDQPYPERSAYVAAQGSRPDDRDPKPGPTRSAGSSRSGDHRIRQPTVGFIIGLAGPWA